MVLLKLAFSSIDLLAWPALALGYPLFASIRAVETDSKYHMRKLVMYWTLLSLFSLFEFAFLKIIEGISFWPSLRLVVIFWLVMPQFEGTCLAYEGFVRPILSLKLQEVIDMFYKLKEERLFKRETFLEVVEKYIKENGSESLENLIALQKEHESQKCLYFQKVDKILHAEEEFTAVPSKQVHDEQSISSAQLLNGTLAVTNVKERTPPKESGKSICSETPITKIQQEWTCDLCKVTTASESILNAHLQGIMHKSKIDSLKASLLDAKYTGSSPKGRQVQHMQSVSAAWYPKGTHVAPEVKEIMPPKETAEKITPKTLPIEKALQEWKCDICKVTTTSKKDLNAHLQGSKHKLTLESLKASTNGAQHRGSSPSGTSKLNEKIFKESGSELEKLMESKTQTRHEACVNSHGDIQVIESDEKNGSTASQQQVQDAQSVKAKAVWVPKGTDSNFELKGMTPPEASRASTPPLKKPQQVQTGDLCKVIATSEKTANADLYKKTTEDSRLSHSPTCKASQGYLKDGEGSTTGYSKMKTYKHRCIVCDVKLLSDVDLASHLKGKLHSSNIEKMEKLEAMIS